MKPAEFDYQTGIAAKGQPEYLPLPFMDLQDGNGTIVTCWECTSQQEREEFLKTGKIYVSLMTFGQPIQPLFVTPNIDDFISLT